MIVDTHCHLDFKDFDSDRDAVIERAGAAGVSHLLNVGSSLEGSRKSVELASRRGNIFAAVGIHPHHADEVTEDMFGEIEHLAANKKVVAIGEVGLDYSRGVLQYALRGVLQYAPTGQDKQKKLFVKFIKLSEKLKLPLIIHNRDAPSDTLEILKENCSPPVRGVMHCFSGDTESLNKFLEMGLFISFTCNLTFKNAKHLREVAKHLPPDRLLLETDAPFLAPQTMRGKRNEPAYITELRDTLSGLLNLPKAEIERITTRNAKALFNL